MRPTRATWITVLAPLTTRAANTTQDRYASPPPPAPTRMAGVSTTPVTVSTAYCSPSPSVSGSGGRSSGS